MHLVGILFPHINGDAWSKSHQIYADMCLQEHSGFVATDRLTSYSSVELEKSGPVLHIHSDPGQTGSEVGTWKVKLFTSPVRMQMQKFVPFTLISVFGTGYDVY